MKENLHHLSNIEIFACKFSVLTRLKLGKDLTLYYTIQSFNPLPDDKF